MPDGTDRVIIHFEAEGNEPLKLAINELDKAIKQLLSTDEKAIVAINSKTKAEKEATKVKKLLAIAEQDRIKHQNAADVERMNIIKKQTQAEITSRKKVFAQRKKALAQIRKMKELAKQNKTSFDKLGISQKQLRLALKGSTGALRKLNLQMQHHQRAGILATRNTRILGGALSVLRSKILIATFAIGGAVAILNKFLSLTSRSAQIETMTHGFLKMGEQFGFNEQSLGKLDKAVDGTVTKFDLLAQANNALLLGIVNSDDEMAELFDTAQRLAKAVGQDARFGIESLVTGLGRQSRLMLDNLGLIVKTEKAYQEYADQLGITVSIMSEEQKKRAFIIAGLDQARRKVALFGKESLDSADYVKAATVSMGQAWLDFADTAEPFVTKFLVAMSFRLKQMAGTAGVGGAVKGFEELTAISREIVKIDEDIVKWEQSLNAERSRNREISLSDEAIKERINKLESERAALVEEQVMAIYARTEAERQSRLAETIGETLEVDEDLIRVEKLLADQYKLTTQFKISEIEATLAAIDAKMFDIGLTNEQAAVYDKLEKELADLKAGLELESDATEGLTDEQKELLANMRRALDLYSSTKKAQIEVIEGNIAWVLANASLFGSLEDVVAILEDLNDELDGLKGGKGDKGGKEDDPFGLKQAMDNLSLLTGSFSGASSAYSNMVNTNMQNEINALKQTDAYRNASMEKRQSMEDKVLAKYKKEQQRIAKLQKAESIAQATINTYEAASKAYSQGGIFGAPLAAMITALGLAQVAAIAATPLPKYAAGGEVGGKLHSQGGTMIEAERGEFVMSRESVRSIGIETMNQINKTGSVGGITVNINAPLVDETVRDSILPAIARAQRMGLA